MRVTVITAPDPVVSLEDAKLHLRVTSEDEDTLIAGMVAAATAHIDGPAGWLGRAVGKQVLEARFGTGWPTVTLPFPPVIELVSVSYLDAVGTEQMADLDDVELFGAVLGYTGSAWPWASGSTRREAVRIRYRAGYDEMPAPIRAAILLMTGDLYNNRETTIGTGPVGAVPMSTTVEALLAPYRVFG